MTRGTKAVLGTGVVCLGLAASAVWADRSPLAAQAAPPRPSRPLCLRPRLPRRRHPTPVTSAHHAAATADSAEHNQVIAKYCAGCHNDRRPAAGLSLRRLRRQQGGRQGRGRREDDREAAGGHDAAARRAEAGARRARGAGRGARAQPRCRSRGLRAQSRPPHVSAHEPSGVRTRHQGAAGARRQRRRLAAARHQERQLRQHRRRAGAFADAARVVPERGHGHQPHGGRRSDRADHRHDLYEPQLPVAASLGSRRRRAVWHARRHCRRARVSRPTRSTSSSWSSSRARTRGSRTWTSRSTASASRCSTTSSRRWRAPTAAARRRSRPSRSSCAPGSTRCRRRSSAAPKGPYEDLIKPHGWSYAGGGSGGSGITTLPARARPRHRRSVSRRPACRRRRRARRSSAAGPRARPTSGRAPARSSRRLGAEAYRRPLSAAEVERLMPFYEKGARRRRDSRPA